jgi:hypothetical protein
MGSQYNKASTIPQLNMRKAELTHTNIPFTIRVRIPLRIRGQISFNTEVAAPAVAHDHVASRTVARIVIPNECQSRRSISGRGPDASLIGASELVELSFGGQHYMYSYNSVSLTQWVSAMSRCDMHSIKWRVTCNSSPDQIIDGPITCTR